MFENAFCQSRADAGQRFELRRRCRIEIDLGGGRLCADATKGRRWVGGGVGLGERGGDGTG